MDCCYTMPRSPGRISSTMKTRGAERTTWRPLTSRRYRYRLLTQLWPDTAFPGRRFHVRSSCIVNFQCQKFLSCPQDTVLEINNVRWPDLNSPWLKQKMLQNFILFLFNKESHLRKWRERKKFAVIIIKVVKCSVANFNLNN